MTSKLPVISGKESIKVFEKIGYRIVRQRGSHIRLRDEINKNHLPLTVPNHREIKPGLLRKLIKDANLTVEEFNKILYE